MCIHPETKWTVTSSLVHGCVMAIIKWDCILIFENYLTVRDKQCRMIVEGVQVACFNQEICVVTPSFLAWSFRDQCVAKFWSIGFKTNRKYFSLGIALTFSWRSVDPDSSQISNSVSSSKVWSARTLEQMTMSTAIFLLAWSRFLANKLVHHL